MVAEGDTAPDFTLEGYGDGEIREVTLSETLAGGTPAVLTFYVYDYSPVCTDQMCEMNDMEFLTFNPDVAVFGISTDGPYSHRQFATDNDLSYPLLTDGDKEVYDAYGLVETTDGGRRQPRRGILVVDTDRTVRYRWVAEGNWKEWNTALLRAANEVVERLLAG